MSTVSSRAELEQVVRDYERCVNQGDLDELLALFTEDAVFYDPVGWMDEFADVAEPQPGGLQPRVRRSRKPSPVLHSGRGGFSRPTLHGEVDLRV